MTRKVTIDFESDLSGEPGAETVEFTWGGHEYEIDLTEKERAAFQKAIQGYLDKARVKVGKGAKKAVKPARIEVGGSPASVRAWANSQNIPVPKRGRIPADVYAQYEKAMKAPRTSLAPEFS